MAIQRSFSDLWRPTLERGGGYPGLTRSTSAGNPGRNPEAPEWLRRLGLAEAAAKKAPPAAAAEVAPHTARGAAPSGEQAWGSRWAERWDHWRTRLHLAEATLEGETSPVVGLKLSPAEVQRGLDMLLHDLKSKPQEAEGGSGTEEPASAQRKEIDFPETLQVCVEHEHVSWSRDLMLQAWKMAGSPLRRPPQLNLFRWNPHPRDTYMWVSPDGKHLRYKLKVTEMRAEAPSFCPGGLEFPPSEEAPYPLFSELTVPPTQGFLDPMLLPYFASPPLVTAAEIDMMYMGGSPFYSGMASCFEAATSAGGGCVAEGGAVGGAPTKSPEQKVRQLVDFYFSPKNLARDLPLRTKMDAEGWVSLEAIAALPRMARIGLSAEATANALVPLMSVFARLEPVSAAATEEEEEGCEPEVHDADEEREERERSQSHHASTKKEEEEEATKEGTEGGAAKEAQAEEEEERKKEEKGGGSHSSSAAEGGDCKEEQRGGSGGKRKHRKRHHRKRSSQEQVHQRQQSSEATLASMGAPGADRRNRQWWT
eukprot:TRINITY_DN14445_c0_g1_i6.p1 TRINITY_DN14445_c0_g1~~TRINITY_DN14445_c0_g1_i6.p1  ORF type:complete len:537 (+),score=156.69 TRINITY_DN14445_c0_g1_i6:101-1711(+)